MNIKRMKSISEEQTKNAVAHWRRALTQVEARDASKAVKKAFADVGIDADVSGPMMLAEGETSIFGRTYRYNASKCPLWGGHSKFSDMGWKSPYVVVKLKKPVEKIRSSIGSTIKNLTEIRIQVEPKP